MSICHLMSRNCHAHTEHRRGMKTVTLEHWKLEILIWLEVEVAMASLTGTADILQSINEYKYVWTVNQTRASKHLSINNPITRSNLKRFDQNTFRRSASSRLLTSTLILWIYIEKVVGLKLFLTPSWRINPKRYEGKIFLIFTRIRL